MANTVTIEFLQDWTGTRRSDIPNLPNFPEGFIPQTLVAVIPRVFQKGTRYNAKVVAIPGGIEGSTFGKAYIIQDGVDQFQLLEGQEGTVFKVVQNGSLLERTFQTKEQVFFVLILAVLAFLYFRSK